jgi:hypothetical protein
LESASTFAHKIVEVLQAAIRKKGVNFQMFFTSHPFAVGERKSSISPLSISRWKKIFFLKNNNKNNQDCFYPYTVVFDSPGCKYMSEKRGTFDVRLDGRSIDLQHLDMTSYLPAPNRINSWNSHIGTVYRNFTDLSDMDRRIKQTALYNLATHRMEKIVKAFDLQTGQIQKDEQGKLKVQEVLDWTICASFTRDKKYKKFYEWAEHLNNYQYLTATVNKCVCC